MTSLTERYVAAALRGIPDRQRSDVERELRSSIADAVEDRVGAGEERPAAETAVLEGLGDPARLSAGITGRPLYLIGPDLFLEYRQLLLMLVSTVVPVVAVALAGVQLATGGDYADAVAAGIGGGLNVGVHLVFWVTLTFFLVERADSARGARAELKQAIGPWSVKRLPDVAATGRIGVAETIGEMLTAVLSIVGLLWLRGSSWVSDANGDPISVLDTDLWSFWLPVLIAGLAVEAGFHVVTFLVGRWTMPLAVAHAALQVAIAGPLIVLALTGSIINPAFAQEINWPALAEGDGVVMLVLAAGAALVTAYEVFEGFRRALAGRRATEVMA